jgi:hypothetical protein
MYVITNSMNISSQNYPVSYEKLCHFENARNGVSHRT